jgi:hypothetical protein
VTRLDDQVTDLYAVLARAVADAQAAERRRIGLWLEEQSVIARDAPSGVHPQAATRTHSAVLVWAAARVLAEDL